MKEKKIPLLFDAMTNIPSEYITEAAEDTALHEKARARKRKKRWTAILAAVLALCLIMPISALISHINDPLVRYRNHPYAAVLSSLYRNKKEASYLANLREGNLFDQLSSLFLAGAAADGDKNFPTSGGPTGGSLSNQAPDDITDNQVEGVLEADIVKRSDTHIYYLYANDLRIYTLDGENSRAVATLPLVHVTGNTQEGTSYQNFYLSGDKLILEGTLVIAGRTYTRLVTLSQNDLSDGKIDETPAVATLEGRLLSTRLVGDSLLVMTHFYEHGMIDVKNENYLPHYQKDDAFVALTPDQITASETPSNTAYTVMYLVNGTTLAVKDSHALLGEPSAQYVSDKTVYLASESTYLTSDEPTVYPYNEDRTCLISKTVSHIEAIRYTEEGFTVLGDVTVDGEIKDQYSLDEYENRLRVAVTTRDEIHALNRRETKINGTVEKTNASLYVISLEDFRILSEATKFAPENESVQSVRFDKELAYICTAEVRTMTDPVYRFDLSNPDRITSLDTGTIDGYSSSLVELENGDLLGIGYGASRNTFKLEIYRKEGTKLISKASHEIDLAEFSENYKSYYINREEGLFGIPIYVRASEIDGVMVYENDMRYYLFSYDGETLSVKKSVSLGNHYYIDTSRGFVYENDLYVISPSNLTVIPLLENESR